MGWFSSDAELLTDGAIYSKMRELISSAQESLIIVSPYVGPTGDFLRQVIAAAKRGVQVLVLFRREKLPEYRNSEWLNQMLAAGVTLATIDRLHSKIYSTESGTLVTSMNFTSTSGENSFEVGVYFESDHALTEKVDRYFEELDSHTELVTPGASAVSFHKGLRGRRSPPKATAPTGGHCIRCGTDIALNAARPYCVKHYEQWAKYKDPDYQDKVCHACGRPHAATMRKPLCRSCYSAAG